MRAVSASCLLYGESVPTAGREQRRRRVGSDQQCCQGLSLPSPSAGDKKKEGGRELGGRALMGE